MEYIRDRVGKFSPRKGLDSAVHLPAIPVEPTRDEVQASVDLLQPPEGAEYRIEGEPGAYTAYIMVAADIPRSAYIDERSRTATKTYTDKYRAAQTALRELPDVKFVNIIRAPEVKVEAHRTSRPYAYQGRAVVDMELASDRGSFTARVPSSREDDAVQWLAQTGQFPVLERVVGRAEAGRLIRTAEAENLDEGNGLF